MAKVKKFIYQAAFFAIYRDLFIGRFFTPDYSNDIHKTHTEILLIFYGKHRKIALAF